MAQKGDPQASLLQAGSQGWSLCPQLPSTPLPPTPNIAMTPHHNTFGSRIVITPLPFPDFNYILLQAQIISGEK